MAMVSIFWIERKDDETVKLFVGENPVGALNHDTHGWQGMQDAEKMFRAIAKAVGAEVRET